MGSKYAEALGFWEHRIYCKECFARIEKPKECEKCVSFSLKPRKIHNLEFAGIVGNKQRREDLAWMFNQIGEIYKKIVHDTYPMNDEEKKDFDELVFMNINQIMEDMLIAFRWTTKEQMEIAKKEQIKDLTDQKKTSI